MKNQIIYAVFSEKNLATIITPYPMGKKASLEFFKRFDDSIKMSQVYRYN